MREHKQIYVGEEYSFRLGTWLSNLRIIKEHNSGDSSWKLGLNHLSAYTPSEYRSLLNFYKKSIPQSKYIKLHGDIPDSIDWRKHGVVNPIKNQGNCASGWAFASIQAAETQWAIVKNELFDLSEQNLIDCVKLCWGCNGGTVYFAYDYVQEFQNNLFATSNDYPYVGIDQKCNFDKSKGVCPISYFFLITIVFDEEEMQLACAKIGAFAASIDASQHSFQSYSSGIYDPNNCDSTNTNHEVGVVGYGTHKDIDYWIVRNSWGDKWGENGYIRMVRNKMNKCGIATQPIIPVVK